MQVYSLPAEQTRIPATPRAVALGVFDGVHLGHRAVIMQAVDTDYPCAVYTFRPGTVTTKPAQPLLCPGDAFRQLELLGTEELFEVDFSTVCNYTPEEFVQRVLCEQLHAAAVTCGFNYRFGRGGQGDAATLTALCAARGIAVTVVPPVELDGIPISSTAIRRAIAAGELDAARRMLGYSYRLHLPVVSGQQLGRRLGVPTINQILPPDTLHPPFGVYASCAIADGQVYPAVTNIGRRPTVGSDVPLAETYIDGFSGDLYGQMVTVYPLRRLRGEEKFSSLEALQAQIGADITATRGLFTASSPAPVRAVLFDFDDTLGARSEAFRRAVELFIDRHYPALLPAQRQQRIEEMIAYNNYGYGMPVGYPDYVRRFLTFWEPPAETADMERAITRFLRDFARSYRLYPDTLSTLQELRQRGFLLGVITNGNALVQNQKLDHSGLRPLFDVVMVCGEEGVQKPNPEIFRRAAARLGLPCESCLFVGDHPINDVQAPRSVEMKAVYMDAHFPTDHPLYQLPAPRGVPTIQHLAELTALPGQAAPLDLSDKIG